LYGEHGIDITKEPLRIAVCAQHNNGGISVDSDWQTNVTGLYAAGECAGTFGVFRPGGTALNSTQVGSLRAAEHIAYRAGNHIAGDADALLESAADEIMKLIGETKGVVSAVRDNRRRYQETMSRDFSFIRDKANMRGSLADIIESIQRFAETERWRDPSDIPELLKNLGIVTMQTAVAASILYSAEQFGSRGSAMVIDGGSFMDRNPEKENEKGKAVAVTAVKDGVGAAVSSRPVRPIPDRELWFEKVWNEYNKITEKRSDQDPVK
ncbi:MAG: FAD-binding protein, partial [Clostridiales bacterium]|nr:FAD-binding protein [Clostridiales bacterium]